MDNTNTLFITAAKNKFRYESVKGSLSTEDLFDLDLVGKNNFDLDNVAQSIASQLEAVTQKSFVNITPNPKKRVLEQKLEIVKAVIKIKQDEQAQAERRMVNRAKRDRLLEALHQAENNQLANTSIEDLKQQIEDLETAGV